MFLVVRAAGRERGVITDHREFGRRLLAGEDLYAPYLDPHPLHAPYPPSFGLLTAPFACLPDTLARVAWAAASVLALGYVLWRLRAPQWVLAVTVLVAARYVLRDTHGGGGNLFNVALVFAAIAAAGQARPGRSGLALGASLATKPTQALFVPLLAALSSGRAALWSVVVAAALAATTLLHPHGIALWQRWFAGTLAYARTTDVFAAPEYGFPPFTWMNQSLRYMVARYLGTVPESFAAQVPGFFPGLGLPPPVVAAVATLLGGTLLAVTAVVVWRRRHDLAARPGLVAAALALSLLLSPISWKAHHVALIPALALAVAQRRFVFLGVYVLLCSLGEELVGKDLKNVQQSLYLTTIGTLALWGLALRTAAVAPAVAPVTAPAGPVTSSSSS